MIIQIAEKRSVGYENKKYRCRNNDSSNGIDWYNGFRGRWFKDRGAQ